MKETKMLKISLVVTVAVFCGSFSSVVSAKEDPAHGVHHPMHGVHYHDKDHNVEYDHKAVLGSEDANEEFAHLPPHEAKKRLATMVDKMDLDKSGALSHEELTAWITKSFIDLNREEALSKMRSADLDRDNVVTWKEYLSSVYGYQPHELADMDVDKNPQISSFMDMINEDHARFRRADLNGDGQLSVEEYSPFLHPYSFPHMQEYELDRTLKEYDRNHDNHVDFQEYLGDSPGSQEMQLVDKENFENYDVDKDALLSREELRAWVLPDMKDSVSSEVEHLFIESDIDKDNKLQKQEILDRHEFWVGSAATDYGSQLHRHDPQEL